MRSRRYSKTHPEPSETTIEHAARLALVGSTLAAIAHPTEGATLSSEPLQLVRAMQTARRGRASFFNGVLFADPAWDMLLELYARHLENTRINVSNLCAAAQVPATTALRWVAGLEQADLVTRKPDTTDARRHWMELTATGIERMNRYFETMAPGAGSIETAPSAQLFVAAL